MYFYKKFVLEIEILFFLFKIVMILRNVKVLFKLLLNEVSFKNFKHFFTWLFAIKTAIKKAYNVSIMVFLSEFGKTMLLSGHVLS